jgi:hypothetical protein
MLAECIAGHWALFIVFMKVNDGPFTRKDELKASLMLNYFGVFYLVSEHRVGFNISDECHFKCRTKVGGRDSGLGTIGSGNAGSGGSGSEFSGGFSRMAGGQNW